MGVVARSFGDYLWLLAGGLGPLEAVEYPEPRPVIAHFRDFATTHSGTATKSAVEVIAAAISEFPTLAEDLRALCR